jgi:hypothetical protein
VIVVFVGDQDAIDTFDIHLDGRKSRKGFALAKSGVDEEAGALRLE